MVHEPLVDAGSKRGESRLAPRFLALAQGPLVGKDFLSRVVGSGRHDQA